MIKLLQELIQQKYKHDDLYPGNHSIFRLDISC